MNRSIRRMDRTASSCLRLDGRSRSPAEPDLHFSAMPRSAPSTFSPGAHHSPGTASPQLESPRSVGTIGHVLTETLKAPIESASGPACCRETRMNRSIVLVAIFLCASCAHTSPTSKPETEQLAESILLGDSQHPTCARGEISYCRVTRASHFTKPKAEGTCSCGPNNQFSRRGGVTAPTPGTRVR
jgi:hypothetical protein